MTELHVGKVVTVHCREPKEKLWGLLQRLDGVGVALRGMDLASVEDWIRQEASGGEPLLTPSTFFVPMHRVQRIDLDRAVGPVASFADRFLDAGGGDLREALAGSDGTQP